MKYYVVSDVHAFYDELVKALQDKGFFEDADCKLIICGDLLDRGKQPIEMQNFVAELLEQDRVILVRGNHEDLLEELTENLEEWMQTGIRYTHHDTNGTLDTVLKMLNVSYEKLYMYTSACQRRLYGMPFFKTVLPAMRNYYETPNYVFVHGWIPSVTVGNPYDPTNILPYADWRNATSEQWRLSRWLNGMFAFSCGVTEPNKTVVCGHIRASWGHCKLEGNGYLSGRGYVHDYTPFVAKGIMAIDACTKQSGFVNCVVIED